jgi:hypothetical protein
LTLEQGSRLDRIYDKWLVRQRRCVDRLVEASNRVGQLIRDGAYDDQEIFAQTQALAVVTVEEQTLARTLNEDIAAVLSTEQRRRIVTFVPDRSAK